METSTSTIEGTGNPNSFTPSNPGINPPNSNHTITTSGETEAERRNRVRRERYAERTNGTANTTAQNIPRNALVDEDEEPEIIPPTSTHKKERPSGLTYNKKSKSAKKKTNSDPTTTVMVQSVIEGLFNVSASRLGSHWQLTDDEASSIATPASNIIAKYLDTSVLDKYSDPAALLIAMVVVCAPRVMINVSQKKGATTIAKPTPNVVPSQPTTGNSRGPSPDDNKPAPRYTGDPAKADVDELLNLANAAVY